jgi:hypothetical protein
MRGSAAISKFRTRLVLAALVGAASTFVWPTQGLAFGNNAAPGAGVSSHGKTYGKSFHGGHATAIRRGSGLRWNIGGAPGQWTPGHTGHGKFGPNKIGHGKFGHGRFGHAGWNRGIPLYVDGPISAFAPTPGVPPGVQRIEVEWPDPVPTVLGIRRQPAADPVSYIVDGGRVRSVVHAAPQSSSGPAVFERERSGAWRKAVRGDSGAVQVVKR